MIEGARASGWGRRTGVTVALLLLVFGLRLGNRALFYDLFSDKVRQIVAAGNLLRGRGISACWADPADLARIPCQPQTDWPAGYPMLSAAITKLSGDFIVTDAIIDAIALALVLLAAGSLIRRFHAAERADTAYRWFLAFSAISFAPYVYLTATTSSRWGCTSPPRSSRCASRSVRRPSPPVPAPGRCSGWPP